MLVRHPTIYLDADATTTDALLVDHGRVVAIGDEARARAAGHDVVEPEGACVFPGLTDAHIHLWGLGLRAGAVSFRGATTTEAVYHELERYDLARSPSGWVLGKDWNQNDWRDADSLSLARLDALWPDTPVVLRRIDGHALWVNSEALRRSGIDPAWDPGPGGHLGRDASGALNGLLVDDAMHPVLDATPEPGEAEDEAAFLESCRLLARHGVTSAHKAWMPVDRLPMLERLRDAETLPIRLHLLFDCHDPRLAEVLERGPWSDTWISARGIKFFADGAMGSRGAHMLEPYRDGGRGLTIDGPDELARIAGLAAAGWQVAVHAIGDAGARNVLDAFAAISDAARQATRPRLEHAQIMHPDDVARMGELGVIASIQPIHLYSDAAWAHRALTEVQLARLFRWRDLADVTRICGGSDYPIEDVNPWHGISVGLTRMNKGEVAFEVGQRLERHELLHAYTTGAAWAGHAERFLGTLHPGFAADFVALGADPFRASPEALWDMEVLQTFVAGRPTL